MQGSLFQGIEQLETLVISHKGDFESLFDGFTKMRAIAYVVSSDLLSEFFQKRGYEKIEIVVGEDLTEPALRQELQDKPVEVLEALATRVENGSLRILVSRRSIHTKLYILERTDTVRIIQTSANLTETARKASQVNYAWYADVPAEHEFVKKVLQDYKSHTERCSLFMEELVNLFKEHESTPRGDLIKVWVKGETILRPELETAKIFQEIAAKSLLVVDGTESPVVVVELPELPAHRRETERLLKPLKPIITANMASIPASAFVNYVHETYGIPLMRVDLERRELRLGLKGSILNLTEPLPDMQTVNKGLEHIENYVHTVNLGKSQDVGFAKASMFEALLYIFFSPFANEYMRKKRMAYGLVDTRGPRFLYIYGPAQNGKTTFFRFALKLLTGQDMKALPREEFLNRKIRGAATVGTVFPLVFDDVGFRSKPWTQDLIKSYWETWWRGNLDVPQLIMSSNEPRLQEWAKSRVKRIDFDVHFASTEAGKRTLKELFERDNSIFRWFSYLYLRRLVEDNKFSDDELYVARAVMQELYTYADRKQPDFFLDKPVEAKYDLGKKRWSDLIYGRRDAKMVREKERLLVRFPEQMPFWELGPYEGYLPPEVKARREGNTIIIETPEEFDAWCPEPRRAWPWSRK